MVELRHFSPREFGEWWPQMSVRLLVLLDVFRGHWGRSVMISASPLALGRHGGDSTSQHNVDRWGVVRAADIMPDGLHGSDSMAHAVHVANQVGMTGIGIYPHWRPRPGIHVDVRRDRQPGNPSLWSALRVDRATPEQLARGSVHGDQVYLALADGYEAMR